ncbi:MAG: 50S ribosomal protein L25 [Candidatus Doudnabacteria bacterium]
MSDIAIQATKREVLGKRVKGLRNAGKLPGVLYGHDVKTQEIEMSDKDFQKAFKQAGESTLINLLIEGKTHPVLVQEAQRHYLNDQVIHVDFYAVNMKEKLKVRVPIHFLGEAPAVKALGGTLVKNLSEIEVECLPGDIPQHFEIDISALNTFEDVIRVANLSAGDKVTVLDPKDEVIVTVAPPRTEEEMKSLQEAVVEDVTKVEGVIKPEAAAEGAVVEGEKKAGPEKAEKKEDKK